MIQRWLGICRHFRSAQLSSLRNSTLRWNSEHCCRHRDVHHQGETHFVWVHAVVDQLLGPSGGMRCESGRAKAKGQQLLLASCLGSLSDHWWNQLRLLRFRPSIRAMERPCSLASSCRNYSAVAVEVGNRIEVVVMTAMGLGIRSTGCEGHSVGSLQQS